MDRAPKSKSWYNARMAIDPRHIELSPEMKQALAEKAEQSGLPWTEVLTEALRMFRPSRSRQRVESSSRSFYDAMMEDGAIGVVKEGLPEDLATNPRHMEGFGRDHQAGSD
jgi:hypothetical protein